MIKIEKISENKKQFMDLLLLADESELMIDKYLSDGDLFALYDDDLKSVCVVLPIDSDTCELKNISTYEQFQGKGYGRALINFVSDFYRSDYKFMLVGTGETPGILSFYNSCGFEYLHRIKNFFIDNYDHVMFDGDIQLVDMIYLKKDLLINKLMIRPFQDTDVDIYKIWLHKDHVSKWYHDIDDWLKEIKERSREFSFLRHFIVKKGDEPIGFCQYYDCFDAKEAWYSVESKGEVFSIDYLIGEEKYLRKGFGKQIIKLLIDEISKIYRIFEIIVQPEMENTASNKTLKAIGFIYDNNKQYYTIRIGTQMLEIKE